MPVFDPKSSPLLVTGGSGFIGCNLVRWLLEHEGARVVNLDKLTYAGNPHSLEDLAAHPGYSFEQVDLCDADAVRAVFAKHRPAAVLHLAAESHVDRSIDGPGAFIQTNVVGTFNLLQAALDYWRDLPTAGVRVASSSSSSSSSSSAPSEQVTRTAHRPTQADFRFLHVSTDEVYGSLSADAPGFSERTPYDPHSPYSASKAASDHLARAWGDTYGLPVLVTNCSNNYGPYQFPEKLIPLVILKCLRGQSIPVYGNGENIRDWLYVGDHVEALVGVLRRGRPGQTYNIGGNNERRNIDLVRTLCRLLDALHPPADSRIGSYTELITFVSDRPGHDQRYAIDSTKIRTELGWTPKEDFESGFRKTVQWYLENRDWWERILSQTNSLDRLGNAHSVAPIKPR